MKPVLFEIRSDVVRFTGITMENPQHAVVRQGVTAVIGRNGSGKSSFVKILQYGRNFMTNDIMCHLDHKPVIETVEFTDIHSLSGYKVEYYQQRYESTMNDDMPTVADVIGEAVDSPVWRELSEKLNLRGVIDKKTNFLSSGELRKLLIIRALLTQPDLLVLDNPFIGLDAASKAAVEDALRQLAATGVSIMLVLTDIEDVPEFVDDIIEIDNFRINPYQERANIIEIDALPEVPIVMSDAEIQSNTSADQNAISINHCKVKYGQRTIIEDFCWEIKRGEAWALSGPNGSGKSTILSLINADNPQAYSNDIEIFGTRRGSGESIWEIKRKIGFMSSEQHICYGFGYDTVSKVLADGCRPAIDRYKPLPEEDSANIERWVRYFGMEEMMDRKFGVLSFGEQRLVLMVRALLGAREMLILDEPLHGLDRTVKAKALRAIDALVATGITLIYVTHNPEEYPKCITHRKTIKAPSVP